MLVALLPWKQKPYKRIDTSVIIQKSLINTSLIPAALLFIFLFIIARMYVGFYSKKSLCFSPRKKVSRLFPLKSMKRFNRKNLIDKWINTFSFGFLRIKLARMHRKVHV